MWERPGTSPIKNVAAGSSPCSLFLILLTLSALAFLRAEAAVKPDETVTFFPSIATPVTNGWRLEIKGTIHEAGRHPLQTEMIRKMLGLDDDDWTDAQRRLFRSRTEYFLVDNERGKVVQFEVYGKSVRSGKSLANGQFTAEVTIDGDLLRLRGIGPEGGTSTTTVALATSTNGTRALPIQIHFVPQEGWSVISDIDDTIKISHVRDRQALIRATFCEPFQVVPDMAAIYRDWARAGAQFHYVSASPWQLFPCLNEFIATNQFPAGTFHMKTFRMKDSSAFKVLGSQTSYKTGEISALLKRASDRRFVLVGDSGEQDPEIYGELARRFPSQVIHIFIRNVTGESGDAPRYRQSFRDLPKAKWSVFEDPELLRKTPQRVR